MLVGCGAPGASARSALSVDAERPLVPRTYTDGGITLSAPTSQATTVTAKDAYGACISGAADCPAGAPNFAELASVTDTQYGQTDASGTVMHTIQGRMSWVFTWHNIACPPRVGPKPPGTAAAPTTLCDWLVLVDASSRAFLITYAGPPAQ
jgi:hypothetical protein